MPSLFVVLDEFSELLAAKPEFIDLFVTIGRVGRSLGVHLLLASQRLEEGRLRGLDTQLSYRIGLRTFSAQESRIVLGVPDAYELPSQPGNGYLKDGTSGLTRFKAAYVSGSLTAAADDRRGRRPGCGPGSPASAPATSSRSSSTRPPARDGTPRLARTDGARRRARSPARPCSTPWWACCPGPGRRARRRTRSGCRRWTPRPPSTSCCPGRTRGRCCTAVLGIVDRPFEQRRDPLWVDLSGAPGTRRWPARRAAASRPCCSR